MPEVQQEVELEDGLVLNVALILQPVHHFLEFVVSQLEELLLLQRVHLPELLTSDTDGLPADELLTHADFRLDTLVPVVDELLVEHLIDETDDAVESIMELDHSHTVIQRGLN